MISEKWTTRLMGVLMLLGSTGGCLVMRHYAPPELSPVFVFNIYLLAIMSCIIIFHDTTFFKMYLGLSLIPGLISFILVVLGVISEPTFIALLAIFGVIVFLIPLLD